MATVRRSIVNTDIERKILIGLIVDTAFCSEAQKMIRPEYFRIEYAKTILEWVGDYFLRYKKAPGKDIQEIYKSAAGDLKEAEAEILGEFLNNLSGQYETEQFNTQYLMDQTRLYFRERAVTILKEKIDGLILRGKIEEAERFIQAFNKIAAETSCWFNPLAPENVSMVFDNAPEAELFSLPDRLGDLTGILEREWLVAFMGPMKRGKSWYLQELAITALAKGFKVAFFSFEMNKYAVSKRVYKRISMLASRPGSYLYPVFDCERNQDGTCKKDCRVCEVAIKETGQSTPDFSVVPGYIPCQKCKGTEDFIPAIWAEVQVQKDAPTVKQIQKKVKDWKKLYGDNLRIIAHPAYTAGWEDVYADLEDLEYQDGFIPDVICFDYFDIMDVKEKGVTDPRTVADRIWKRGKGFAGERHCLVATVLQSNRPSIKKKSLEQEDTGEDIRKLAHVDLMCGLNQTPEEKKKGIMRVSVVAHRHEDFAFDKEVIVLQSYVLGQPLIDSEWAS